MDYDKLIELTIEIEGLLRVLRDRESGEARILLENKYSELRSLMDCEKNVAEPALTIDEIETVAENHMDPETSEKSDEKSKQPIVIDEISEESGEPSDFEEPEVPSEFEEIEGPSEFEETEKMAEDHEHREDGMPLEIQVSEKTQNTDASEVTEIPEETEELMKSAEVEPLTLNDAVKIKKSSDFSKAFSINDKFRFIREVFDGDAAAFNKSVARISGFQSLDIAFDYIFNELQLDAEKEAVGEFVNIVANHFNA